MQSILLESSMGAASMNGDGVANLLYCVAHEGLFGGGWGNERGAPLRYAPS